jgi:spermidine synthase
LSHRACPGFFDWRADPGVPGAAPSMEQPTPSALTAAGGGGGGFAVSRPVLYAIFFLSGVSALIYQLCWQRTLLTVFGSNVESAAIVVSSFMVGLGIGSLFGGWVSERPGLPLLAAFSAAELVIGLFGVFSLGIFKGVAAMVSGSSLGVTAAVCFALLLLPTLFMGSTLPLLVTHHVKSMGNVGKSVSWLYFVNTLGAAAGAVLAAMLLLAVFGMKTAVITAAALNILAAVLMALNWLRERRAA